MCFQLFTMPPIICVPVCVCAVCVCCVCVCVCVCDRLKGDLVMVEEGQEPKDLCSLIGNKTSYDSLLNGRKYMKL